MKKLRVSPARTLASDILLRVDREDSYASELLHSPRAAQLSTADHALATELVMGVERWRSLLDLQLQSASSQKLERLDPEVLMALRLGAYQMQFLTRIPARAAIYESVELVKALRKTSAAPFVNAVLRKVDARPRQDSLQRIHQSRDAAGLAATSAHPEWLVNRWVKRYGLEATRAIVVHNQTVPVSCVYVGDDQVAREVEQAGVVLAPGLLLSSAGRVVAGDVTATNAYREGHISIQDEASQLVAVLVGRGQRILDCCAAPGSKTLLLARRNPTAQIIASDLHPHRARLMRHLVRQPNVRVLAANARDLPIVGQFDRVLADVPCSGTGTLARHPEIKWRLRQEDLSDLQSRQVTILKSALERLAPGGRLVYSTCSLETEENETVVETVLRHGGVEVVDLRAVLEDLQRSGELVWNGFESLMAGPYVRTLPGTHPCDGFFAAMLARTAKA